MTILVADAATMASSVPQPGHRSTGMTNSGNQSGGDQPAAVTHGPHPAQRVPVA